MSDRTRTRQAPPTTEQIQTRLTVNRPGDRFEREADQIADRVMANAPLAGAPPAPVQTTPLPPPVAKLSANSEQEDAKETEDETIQARAAAMPLHDVPHTIERGIRRARGGGHPLGTALRAFFEPRFACDFSAVRLHTDASAARSARSLRSHAFTHGHDIFFAAGQFNPYKAAGRHLLAHELAHVLQQTGPATRVPAGFVQRADSEDVADRPTLKSALERDDDEVRALVASKKWLGIKLKPEEVATLLIHLFDGFTGNEDELAAIKIVVKAFNLDVLDDALAILIRKDRFDDLFDDFHGPEYDKMIMELAEDIERREIKATFLDKFVSMWWVDYEEEEAIVVALELADEADLPYLLGNKREPELRSAVDDDELSQRFETVVGDANKERFEPLIKKLEKIFVIKARRSNTTGQRSKAETDRLLKAAAKDLEYELRQYQHELQEALDDPDFEPSDAARINRKFAKRLDALVELKSREFDLEIKYNVEFNRSSRRKFRTNWTKKDYDKIEEILDDLPPEIFDLAPDFRRFGRETDEADYGGQSRRGKGEIAFSGRLSLGTTAHEFGHFVHYADEEMFKDFRALTPWELLLAADFKKHIPDEKRRKKVLKKLAGHRKKELDYEYVDEDRYRYRYARYKPTYHPKYQAGKDHYYRYPKDACFVSRYAATDPKDDFAESFEHYIADNQAFKDKCRDKYDFMHVRVFVKFWLERQMARVIEEVEKDHLDNAVPYTGVVNLDDPIINHYQDPLQTRLENALKALINAKVKDAQDGKLPDPIPMKGSKIIQQTATPYLKQWKDLTALIGTVRTAYSAIASRADSEVLVAVTPDNKALRELELVILEKAAAELYAEFEKPAKQVKAGKHVTMPTWPSVEAIKKKYFIAVKVMPGYTAAYMRARSAKAEFIPEAATILRGFADPAERELVRKFLLTQRPSFEAKATALMDSIMAAILAGMEFSKAGLKDPAAEIQRFKKELHDAVKAKFARKKGGRKVTRKAIGGAAPGRIPNAASVVLTSHGRPMPAALQREMEARFASLAPRLTGSLFEPISPISQPSDADEQVAERLAAQALAGSVARSGATNFPPDFSHVRIHADDRAAASARALRARAYTADNHIVFARDAFAPATQAGRRLLAHELSHIVQPQPAVRRIKRDFWRDLAVFFGAEGSYGDTELLDYLADRRKEGGPERSFDADNKARAIVRNWKSAKAGFELQPEDKVILIEEMLDGPTLDEDEKGILDLLELSELGDVRRIFRDVGAKRIHDDIQDDNRKRLEKFFDNRVEGGTVAALKGSLVLQGKPYVGAPLYAYDWADLLRRVDDYSNYRSGEIADYINALPKAEKQQAMADLQEERAKREKPFKAAQAATMAELVKWNQLVKSGASPADIGNQELVYRQAELNERLARFKVDRVEETLNAAGFSLATTVKTKAELETAAKPLTPADKAAAKAALKPPPATTSAGVPIPFTDTVNYEADLDKLLADLIKGYYAKLVKDKGAVEHADPTKVYDLTLFETIGRASKAVTDEVFGKYKRGSELKADDPVTGLRGNIHDFWQEMEDKQKGMSPDERQAEAKDHLNYLLGANRQVRDLNEKYHAAPEFDDARNPLNDEAKIQEKLADKYKVSHTTEMLHIRRGWLAAAEGATGDIHVQLFRKKAGDEERRYFWERFLVLIHEYLHTLVHGDYRAYAVSFGPNSIEYNALMEGMDSVLTEIVWHHAQKRAKDKDIRDRVEGPAYSKLKFDPDMLPAGRDKRYRSYDQAQELVRAVGLENVYLAYFFGDVSRIGK